MTVSGDRPAGPRSAGPGRSAALLVAAFVVAVEGLVLVVLAVLGALDLTTGRVTLAVSVAVFLLAYGGALLACAWGLAQRRSWARGPVVLAQLIQLGLAWNFRGGETTSVAVALAVGAAVVLVALFSRPGIAALEAPD